MLTGKRILLGITGGIAAYKCASLVRLLRECGAEVQVVMTASGEAFVTPLTMQCLSGRPVRHALLDCADEHAMGHITLARWADLIVVAPASANFLAKMAHGFADDLLSTLCLAAEVPIAIAPAMNQAMWHHDATQTNIQCLQARGVRVWGPESGQQACGELGLGRMREPEQLLSDIQSTFDQSHGAGVRVLITAGPTHEALDPVRYLSNRSSGKMGYAFARAWMNSGADVTLVSGPVTLAPPKGVRMISVTTAAQMHEAVMAELDGVDIFIGAAAVADYTPKEVTHQKIKKHEFTTQEDVSRGGVEEEKKQRVEKEATEATEERDERKEKQEGMTLILQPTVDIVATVAALPKARRPFVVGFAAETEAVAAYGSEKLVRKDLDMVIANAVGWNEGFGKDELTAWVLRRGKKPVALPRQSKQSLAEKLVEWVCLAFKGEYD